MKNKKTKKNRMNLWVKQKKKLIAGFIMYLIVVCLPLVNIVNKISFEPKSFWESITKNQKFQGLQKIKSKNLSKNLAPKLLAQNLNQENQDFLNQERSQLEELSKIIQTAREEGNSRVDSLNNKKHNIITEAIETVIKTDGYFDILNLKTGKIDRVSERDYVVGAVFAEMPPTFHEEALKAQAVSAHTYALKMRQEQLKKPTPSLSGADFSADPSSWNKYVTKDIAKKRYKDKFDEYWNLIESATNDVVDVVMLYEDEPIIAAYHAISSGQTESAADIWGGNAPYLVATKSFGDDLAPGYETTKSFSEKEIQEILKKNFPQVCLSSDPNKWFEKITRTESGTVLKITLGDFEMSGTKLRNLLDLRSANFMINYDKNKNSFDFFVKGYGHDVGLSQYGADYMAKNGSRFDEILKHYYSGVYFGKTQIKN